MSNFHAMNTLSRSFRLALLFGFLACMATPLLAEPATAEAATEATTQVAAKNSDAIYYSIAITMGLACLSAGLAVGKIGSAVMGAAAEKPEIMGKAIAFVGLGEGIALFGFLISLFLLFKI